MPPSSSPSPLEQAVTLQQTREFFNKPRNSASLWPQPVDRFAFEQIIKLIPKGKDTQTALDLGCHWGRISTWLADSYGRVIGVDFAEKVIQDAERRDNIEYFCLDLNTSADQLTRFGAVDLIVAIALFEMIENPAALCQQLAKVCKRSCKVLAMIPNRRSANYLFLRSALWVSRNLLRRPRHIHNNGYTVEQLGDCFAESGFQVRETGSVVGIPRHLVSILPSTVQSFVVKVDPLFLSLFGGSYHWLSCQFRAEE
jgi:2-polyprenyl-3-methyl-5-hydroxy-6-metoxy-1,4-benzoquinol methylase